MDLHSILMLLACCRKGFLEAQH